MLPGNKKTTGNCRTSWGFTLIELLLVVGILVILGGFMARDLSQSLAQAYFTNTIERVAGNFRTAQIYSMSAKEGSSWGVHYESGELTLFKGTNFSTRDPSFDIETPVPSVIVVSGWEDVYFSKLRGLPSTTPSVLIEAFGRAGVVSVGEQGAINRP